MLKIDPALPILRIDPAEPMLRTEPALPTLINDATQNRLAKLNTLYALKTLAVLERLWRPIAARTPITVPAP
jgi:hypothetical protein